MTCLINGSPQIRWVPPYWEDLRVPLSATNLGGSKDPTFAKLQDNGAGSQGVFVYFFRSNLVEELYFEAQLPHSWVEGSTLNPHIHWSPSNSGAGVVRWGLEYTISKPNVPFPLTALIYADDPESGVALEHQIVSFPDITMTGNTISTMMSCRIFRDATHAADTYGATAAALEFDIHYQRNTPGSKNRFTK